MILKIQDKLFPRLSASTPNKLIQLYIFYVQRMLGTRVFGSVKTNTLSLGLGITSNLRILFMGQHNRISIGKSVRISNLKIDVLGSNLALIIDNNAKIHDCYFLIQGDNASLIIGAGAELAGNFLVIADNDCSLDIGRGSLLGAGAQIRLGDGHAIVDINEMKVANKASHVKLHPRVWLGLDCLVLKNVEIGQNSVVGARSVVTKNLPANSLAAGVPAKVIRTGITWLNQRVDSMPDNWTKEILRHTAVVHGKHSAVDDLDENHGAH